MRKLPEGMYVNIEKIEMDDRWFLKELVKSGVEISIKSSGIETGKEDYVKWKIDFKENNKIVRQCVVGGMYDIKKGMLDAILNVLMDNWSEIKKG